MAEFLALTPTNAQLLAAQQKLEDCNEKTACFGLALTQAQAAGLVRQRFETLRALGRVEFGDGVLPALIAAFCDSPFLTRESYAETLGELQALFYHFKGEALERVSDAGLIAYMKTVFNGRAQGSLDLMADLVQERLCRYARGCELAPEDGREEEADDD